MAIFHSNKQDERLVIVLWHDLSSFCSRVIYGYLVETLEPYSQAYTFNELLLN